MMGRAAQMIPLEADAWFTAAELEALGLPGLPGDKRSINRRAAAERWAARLGPDNRLLVRKTKGARGGGVEFHASLLPGEARIELARRGIIRLHPVAVSAQATAWDWLDRQSAKVKAEAQRRLEAVTAIELLCEAGSTRSAAVAAVSDQSGVGRSTLWNWLRSVEGLARGNWLPALAPRRQGGGAEAEIHPDLWEIYKSDALRPEKPPLAACYDEVKRTAKARGIAIPHARTFQRRFEKEVPPSVRRLAREGADALIRTVPDQRRDVTSMHALQAVNVDGHQLDVFVAHPRTGEKVRPVVIAVQDIFSRKIIGWRVDLSENVLATRLAFADVFRNFGIPAIYLSDNSRTFAGKQLSAGAETRYRYAVADDEPAGLFVSLQIEVRFTRPFAGQSKPIERAFREFGDRIWRGPECAGAYTGNSPVNKPANYDSRVLGWDEVQAIVARGITLYNAREGRQAGACAGRSCDQTFAESYAVAPIRQASAGELRMALLASEVKKLDSRTGEVKLYGNRYYAEQCIDRLGERVTVRFDPDDLHREVYLYDREGRFIAEAPVIADHGFFDKAGAEEVAKRRRNARRKAKESLEAHRTLDAAEVAATRVAIDLPDLPEPSVIAPVRHRASVGAAALKPQPAPTPSEAETDIIAALGKVNLRIVE
jgi:transposase InsO family protein